MYATIRRYAVERGKAAEVTRRVEQGFLPLLKRIQGLRSYLVLDAGDDTLISLSVFENRAGAEASTLEAAAWVRDNLGPLIRSGPQVLAGDVLLHQEGAPAHFDITGVPLGDPARRIHDIYEAFNQRDFDRVARQIAPQAEQVQAGTGEVFRGPDGYRKLMRRWSTAFPDAKLQVLNLTVGGNVAVVEFVGRGTNTGPLETPAGEIRPTGKRVEMRCCDVIHLRDGQIVRVDSYYDTASMLRQMGVLSETAPTPTA